MNTATQALSPLTTIKAADLPAIGSPMPGGIFLGLINCAGQTRAIVRASKAMFHAPEIALNSNLDMVSRATSFFDGRANTIALAEAGSEYAKSVLALEIDGCNDFHIPAMDEMEVMYRVAKPSADENYLYARSGINVSAIPPTYPYTADFPRQTELEAFKQGGPEAFEAGWYWTSTQHPGYASYAYCQHFGDGDQSYYRKHRKLHAVAVRSVLVIQ